MSNALRNVKALEANCFVVVYEPISVTSDNLSFLCSDDSQDEDYKSRWRSIRVMYFTMFLSSVGELCMSGKGVSSMQRW